MDNFFIDYDNLLDLAEDQYHVFYGDPEDIDYADFIASFADEEDAKEYINFKNESLDDGGENDGYDGYGSEDNEDYETVFDTTEDDNYPFAN